MEQQEEPALIDDCGNDDKAAQPPPPPPPPSHESTSRDWAALPRDVVLEILGRLRHVDILGGAGLVCAEWRRAAIDEPTLWRHIDLQYFDKSDVINDQVWLVRLAMGRAAVDRSAGLCESFHGIADRDLLAYLADRAPSLRSLIVTLCLPEEYLGSLITKLPMLEWIELVYHV